MEPNNRFDISNIRFGKLTALECVSGHNSKAVWRCKCDCGREKLVVYRDLAYGKTKSCGCANASHKIRELTGQRFGRLVAQERLPERKNGSYLWRCLCDCGEVTFVTAAALTKGQVSSCGCLARDTKRANASDLRGMRFGRLTALEPTERRNTKGSVIWQCKCDCGKETFQSASRLRSGGILSCGCKHQENDSLKRSLTFVDGTCVQFLQNKDKLRSDNTSGVRGVSAYKGKWRARINFKKKAYELGVFDHIEDAITARKKAEERLYGEFLDWYTDVSLHKDKEDSQNSAADDAREN